MKHVMLDLETLGTSNDAAIISIGACRFKPLARKDDKVVHSAVFHFRINLEGNIGAIDPETVRWWLEQSQEAQDALLRPEHSISLRGALGAFDNWIAQAPVLCLWSNGPTFDEVILRSAFKREGLVFPLSYRASRDCRTIFDLGKILNVQDPENTLKHGALADAIFQAKKVSRIYRKIFQGP